MVKGKQKGKKEKERSIKKRKGSKRDEKKGYKSENVKKMSGTVYTPVRSRSQALYSGNRRAGPAGTSPGLPDLLID